MTPALKSFLLCSCLCVSGVLAAAQATTCAADGDEAKSSAIGCVTGEGVVVKSDPETAAQTSEVLPLTPEQRPATPPTVIFENGKLSITAKNSTLSDILQIVGEKTGALIDIPEAANERVVSQLGPGAPRDVIAALLNGSHYNYVVLGNEVDPNAVARVVLTAKGDHGDGAGTPVDSTALAARARAMMQPRALQQAAISPIQQLLQQEQAQEQTVPDFQQAQARAAAVQEPAAQKDQASVTGDGGSPASASGGGATETAAADPASGGTGNQANANAEKTPQQMLQDLYETRRQMMQQTQQQRVAQQQPQDQPAQQ